jgi:arsenite methyltransferase
MLVCGNTADMLSATRYACHFTVTGNKFTHFGLFPCAPAEQTGTQESGTSGACC